MLTPLDIENIKFSKKTLNGYDPDEVDDFLDEVQVDYTKLYKESQKHEKEVEELKEELEKYKNIEKTLQETLIMAKTTSNDIKTAAEKNAEQIVKEAEQKAKEITSNVDDSLVSRQKELDELENKFNVYKAKMESLLISQLEMLKEVKPD